MFLKLPESFKNSDESMQYVKVLKLLHYKTCI